ncbi:PAS domain-containing protein [Candidatus Thorarchaeota archaeon]|nr:MAG: PAS domain-containing protein [Candidatus Thorarchaeota archaeon]
MDVIVYSLVDTMILDAKLLQNTIESLHVGIILVDNDNRIILFNRIAGQMLQQKPDDRIGTSILRCHGEVSEKPVKEMLSNLRSGKMEKYEGWVNFRGRMLYEHIYPLFDSTGDCIAVVEELHDAKEKAAYLKTKGHWKDIHVSGIGEKAPRTPLAD